MKIFPTLIPFFILLFSLTACKTSPEITHNKEKQILVNPLIVKTTHLSVDATIARLKEIIHSKKDKGMTVFSVIDHKAGAARVGLELVDTQVIIFGNPNIGTKLMQANPQIALDLPMKILVYHDGQLTKIVYRNPLLWKNILPNSEHILLPKIEKVLNAITNAVLK